MGRQAPCHSSLLTLDKWLGGRYQQNPATVYILASLCTPDIGEDGWKAMLWNNLLKSWLDHLDKAIQILNWHILPALKFCLKEILLGLVVNTKPTPIEISTISCVTPAEVDINMAYTAQQ